MEAKPPKIRKRIGRPRKDYSAMVTLYKTGEYSMEELGKRFGGITRQGVKQILKTRGVKSRVPWGRPDPWEED